jgi:hypothetical protein
MEKQNENRGPNSPASINTRKFKENYGKGYRQGGWERKSEGL